MKILVLVLTLLSKSFYFQGERHLEDNINNSNLLLSCGFLFSFKHYSIHPILSGITNHKIITKKFNNLTFPQKKSNAMRSFRWMNLGRKKNISVNPKKYCLVSIGCYKTMLLIGLINSFHALSLAFVVRRTKIPFQCPCNRGLFS